MSFSVVFDKETGRIIRQGALSADHYVAESEDIIHFEDWLDTNGKAVDLAGRVLVEAATGNRAVSGGSWEVVRERRNRLLAETDYLMVIDYPISEQNRDRAKIYRQALRDVTLHAKSALDIHWPQFPIFD